MSARTALSGVFGSPSSTDDFAELRQLLNEIGRKSFGSRIGRRALPDPYDSAAWQHLESAGLTRLTSPESGGSAVELALALNTCARHAVTVPLAETDVLAGWLAGKADIVVPQTGALTLALGDATRAAVRIRATVPEVPYAQTSATVVLALRAGNQLLVGSALPQELSIVAGVNLGGEPRDTVDFDLSADRFTQVDALDELIRRGAWARCMQIVGALDCAVESAVAHTRDRHQFGRPLSAFQAVQHSLASMAGEVERCRAAATLAIAAAADYGFSSPQTDYAVTVAKIVLGRSVPAVVTAAHQLHGAIGVTMEHPLWLATMRARSWAGEFGDANWYARRLGRLAMAPDSDVWDLIIGT